MKNKNDMLDMSKIEQEAKETLKEFYISTEEELRKVSKFTSTDINKLYHMILDNLVDLSDLAEAEETIKRRIVAAGDGGERLTYQLNLKKEDIFVENFIKIYLLYNAAVLGVWLTSPDVIEFLKRIVVVGIIGYMTYDLNARYFVSDRRKQKARETIDLLNKYVKISRYDIETFSKFREIYIDRLRVELDKLVEISDFDTNLENASLNKLLEWIKELGLESSLEEELTKIRVRKR